MEATEPIVNSPKEKPSPPFRAPLHGTHCAATSSTLPASAPPKGTLAPYAPPAASKEHSYALRAPPRFSLQLSDRPQRVRSTSSKDGEFSRFSHVMASEDQRSLGSPAAHVVTAVSSSAPPSWPQ